MSSHKDFSQQAPGATGVDRDHPAERGYTLEIVDREQAIVKAHPEPRKKFAICGFAASSRMLAPFADPDWEIWILNQLNRHVPRATRHYDCHANWASDNVEGTDHPGYLAQCGMPVYMTKTEPTIPTSVRYPIERVIAKVAGLDYFTSTVAFMLGLAILEIDEQVERELNGSPVPERFDEARRVIADAYAARAIGVFGIDLIVGPEYERQKACVEYLLGLAQARNITIHLPPQCALLKQLWRYGYEAEPPAWPIRQTELDKRSAALTNEREQLIARLHTIDGARQEHEYWSQVFSLRVRGGVVRLNEESGT